MSESKFNTIIIDDHPLMRQGIRQLMESTEKFNVIGEASNGFDGIELVKSNEVDLIILDLNMKGLSGLETLVELRKSEVDARIIILTVSDAPNDVFGIMNAGADGYLLKDTDPDDLLMQIQRIASGEVVLSDTVKQIFDEYSQDDCSIAQLTSRELDVLRELAKGLSNQDISVQLNISCETVKVHIRNIFKKLKINSRLAVTMKYLEYMKQNNI